MTVHRVEQRLKSSKFLKNRPRSGRLHGEAINKVFENGPCQKMTRRVPKKKVSISTVTRIVKEMGEMKRSRKPLMSVAMIQKRLERSIRLFNDLKNYGNRIFIFSDDKISPVILS